MTRWMAGWGLTDARQHALRALGVMALTGSALALAACGAAPKPGDAQADAGAAAAVPAATTPASTVRLQGLVGSRWIALSLDTSATPGGGLPTLQFISATQVSGSGGCNGFGGKLEIDGDQLRFGPLAATRKLCSATPVMENESQFLRILDQTRSAAIEGDVLVLRGELGAALLRLKRSA